MTEEEKNTNRRQLYDRPGPEGRVGEKGRGGLNNLVYQLITTVFGEQQLALPGSHKHQDRLHENYNFPIKKIHKNYTLMKLVGGGSVINGATPSRYKLNCLNTKIL